MADLLPQALTTLADIKESLGIDNGDNSKDNLIIRKINMATEMIEMYTGRRFKRGTYTDEVYNASGTDQIVLRQRPVVSVTSLSERDTTLNENDWNTVDSELYFLDANAGILNLNFATRGKYSRYKITYVAGFETIPADIQEAAASLAAYLVNNKTSGTAVKSMQEGQRRVEYFDSQGGNNSLFESLGIDEILKSYANYPLGGI